MLAARLLAPGDGSSLVASPSAGTPSDVSLAGSMGPSADHTSCVGAAAPDLPLELIRPDDSRRVTKLLELVGCTVLPSY